LLLAISVGGGGSDTKDVASDVAPSSCLFAPLGGLDSASIEKSSWADRPLKDLADIKDSWGMADSAGLAISRPELDGPLWSAAQGPAGPSPGWSCSKRG
jgi:hypothetical protein